MAKIQVNGVEYELPEEDDLTLGEIADIEDVCGQGYDLSQPGSKVMLAMTYVAMRRKDPTVTLEDVRSVRMIHMEVDDDEPEEVPTEAADAAESNGTPGIPATTGAQS